MRRFSYTANKLGDVLRRLPIFIFLFLALGIFLLPTLCEAQPVPPRSQTLQLIKPITPPPEPPVEKEIRKNRQAIDQNRQAIQENRRELARQKLVRITTDSSVELLLELISQLGEARQTGDIYVIRDLEDQIISLARQIRMGKRMQNKR